MSPCKIALHTWCNLRVDEQLLDRILASFGRFDDEVATELIALNIVLHLRNKKREYALLDNKE